MSDSGMVGQRDSVFERDDVEPLLSGYRPLPGIFDEMVDRDGRVRAHWQPLLAMLARLGPKELSRRFAAADRHLRDSGVFYRVYEDAAGAERPWPLSHVPLLIDGSQWQALKAGLVQRAQLLEAVLADAYGPANLVREARLPAVVIAGNPEFLRPLVGVAPAGGGHLRFYAVDVGRSPAGHWWVLGDRTQAPSGAGYALENRLALSRAMPEDYRGLKVERLAPFFQAFPAELSALNRQDDSRFCVLTPGPMNETYFEHAYLARYLGFLLVEGEDLTVREDGVFIRTVSGLKRAEVLVRRLDADFADPLELNARSRLGVPGLVQAVRDGTVVIANALGSGVVEFSAGAGADRARQRSRAAQRRNVVVRPGARARRDYRSARRNGDRIGLSRRAAGPWRTTGGSRRDARARRANAHTGADRPPRYRLRRQGGRYAFDHAGLAQRPAGAAPVHAAAVPGADQRRVASDARRLRAGCG